MRKIYSTLLLFFVIASCSLFEEDQKPTLSTTEVSNITQNSATTGGIISLDGNSEIIECGVCFNTSNNPTILDSRTSDKASQNKFTSELANLMANTTYYFCAYATNKVGISYGEVYSFKTLSDPSLPVFDVDGNMYETVTIGSQVWLNKNLRTTKLNDGTPILLIAPKEDTGNIKTSAYCYYDDNKNNLDTYGALYNWYAVNSDKLCPAGYHVPTKSEWETLQQKLGGSQVAGGKMKEADYSHWLDPNSGATNSSQFNALPSGYRADKMFYLENLWAIYWSSTNCDATNSHAYELSNENSGLTWSGCEPQTWGLSVRCIRN